MKKSRILLPSILALSGLFAPLKTQAQSSQTVTKPEVSDVSVNTEEYKNDDVETLGINGMPFLIYTPSKAEEKKQKEALNADLARILERQETASVPPPQSDLQELLEEVKEDTLVPSVPKAPSSASKIEQDLNELLAIGSEPNKGKKEVVSATPSVQSAEKEEPDITDFLASAGIFPTPMKLDTSKIKHSEQTNSTATAVAQAEEKTDTTTLLPPEPKKIAVVDQKKELNELLALASDLPQVTDNPVDKALRKDPSERSLTQKDDRSSSLSNSDDGTSEKIAFFTWLAILGTAAAIQGKKYFGEKEEYWPEEGPFPWNELAENLSNKRKITPEQKVPDNTEEILTTKDPLSPFSPIDLQNYLTETISSGLMQSVLKKKQEGVKLLPYRPIELDIVPAKDPLQESNREILAQRLKALKAIFEIQKERAILTKEISKARRQKDEKTIAIIAARRKVLSERIKKARLVVIGNQLDNIREQRRLLTKKITLARRHHDHWQIDSVQKQRTTLKAKEKTVKGFIRQFNYSDYRRQWHAQRKNAHSRA